MCQLVDRENKRCYSNKPWGILSSSPVLDIRYSRPSKIEMVAQSLEPGGVTRPKENPQSAPTLLDLPSEIIDNICDVIENVDDGCHLSYTCSTLRYHAQRRIFKELSIGNSEQLNSLNTCFNSNPLLPDMIRHLKMNTIGVIQSHSKEEGAVAVQKACKFLEKLSRLRSFTLSYRNWAKIPKELQVAFWDLFRRCKGLEKIKLPRLRNLPPDLLDDCAGLRQLAICHHVGDPPIEDPIARTVHRLDSLKIVRMQAYSNREADSQLLCAPPILAYCTSQNGLDLTNLRLLHITFVSCFVDPSDVLNVCASSLKHLRITAPDFYKINNTGGCCFHSSKDSNTS